MNLASGILFAVAIAFGILILWGLFTPRRHWTFGVLGLLIAPVGALGSWYSWMESQSLGWAIGYGVLALIGVVTAVRNFRRKKAQAAN